MKCPYCKNKLDSLDQRLLMVEFHKAEILSEADGTPVVRAEFKPHHSVTQGVDFACPHCGQHLTADRQTAKEILLE